MPSVLCSNNMSINNSIMACHCWPQVDFQKALDNVLCIKPDVKKNNIYEDTGISR